MAMLGRDLLGPAPHDAKEDDMRRPDHKPRAQTLESEIEHYLEWLCEQRGWLCEKVATTGTLGFPDRCVIADGRIVFVELKRPDHRPRKMQVRTLKRLRDHGAQACVVHDADTADLLVETIERGAPIRIADEVTFYVTT